MLSASALFACASTPAEPPVVRASATVAPVPLESDAGPRVAASPAASTAPAAKRNVITQESVFDVYGTSDPKIRAELTDEQHRRSRSLRECLHPLSLRDQHDFIVKVTSLEDRRADRESIEFHPPSSFGQRSYVRTETTRMPEGERRGVEQCIVQMLRSMTFPPPLPSPASAKTPSDPHEREARRFADALSGTVPSRPEWRWLLRIVVESYEPGAAATGKGL